MSRSPAARLRARAAFREEHHRELAAARRLVLQRFTFTYVASVGPAVARVIAIYRAQHGRGPSWSDLGQELAVGEARVLPPPPAEASTRLAVAWNRAAASAAMPMLRAAGWVEYDRQPHSLRPGPRWSGYEKDLIGQDLSSR
ncbi:MAG: hypothetical protein DLM57_11225 [Pseudonocardiales bacterium]|nr:MAG: hypothetical protein DLM57_11225 [Pseudonocardiales bacterium]